MSTSSHHGAPRLLPRWPLVALATVLLIAGGVLVAGGLMGAFSRTPQPAPDRPVERVPVRTEVAGVAITVPRDLVRHEAQRRDGPQPRLDLLFHWPTLEGRGLTGGVGEDVQTLVFMTLQPRDEAIDPPRRIAAIYTRFLSTEIHAAVPGLAARRFVEGSGYDGEELVYDPVRPGLFFLRCARSGSGMAPTCIRELRIDGLDVVVRFSRSHLDDWRRIEASIQSLLAAIGVQAR